MPLSLCESLKQRALWEKIICFPIVCGLKIMFVFVVELQSTEGLNQRSR